MSYRSVAVEVLRRLRSNEERMSVLREFCWHCGEHDPQDTHEGVDFATQTCFTKAEMDAFIQGMEE